MKICMYGAQGHIHTVLDYLEQTDDAAVTAICCEPGEDIVWLKERLAQVNQFVRVYGDYHGMLGRENPDIVIVSSFPDQNAGAARHALSQNIHVFCEKPVAITMAQFERLSQTLKESGAKLYTMLTERFKPAFYTAYRAAEDGLAGTIRLVDARKSYKLGIRPDYYKSRETYAGTLSWVGIHAIDRIYRASGKKFQTVFARSSNGFNRGLGDLETTAVCCYEMEDGVLAAFTCDYYRPAAAETHGDDRLRIVGTHGVIEVMGGEARYLHDGGSEVLPLLELPLIFEEFLWYIRTGESAHLTTEDCMYTTYAALKTMESSDTGTAVSL
ncbi:MAG: Gfo/Idh/MocA family oxidoreductase [Oscillospiraceae bacterium]|nr:Gfo/Idh/MocA family oxidoreductase [Oscillospiraceae bacterium]